MNAPYIESVVKQFKYYKSLGDKSFERLSTVDFHFRFNDQSNSIAILIQHLVGNMLSRFTGFLTEDGEKVWRNRDAEFEDKMLEKSDLLSIWNEGWTCLLDNIQQLTSEDLDTIIYIRNEGHTVLEAINRQLCHYPYHIGQIVMIAKCLNQDNWESLSIAKGKSNEFNQQKFNLPPTKKHFTDDNSALS